MWPRCAVTASGSTTARAVELALAELAAARTNELLPRALNVIADAFQPYGGDLPFGSDAQEMLAYAIDQFNQRHGALERAAP